MKPAVWICSTFVLCMVGRAVADEINARPNHAAEFMQEWHELNCDVTGVRCSFTRHCYDYTFRSIKMGKGELARFSDKRALLKIKSAGPRSENPIKRKVFGREFSCFGESPEHIRCELGFVQLIDEARNLSETMEISSLVCSKRANSFRGNSNNLTCKLSYIDYLIPFLPGHSSHADLDEWNFQIEKSTDTHITISATQKNAERQPYAVERCDLLFEKKSVQLEAIQLHHPDSPETTVYMFKDVVKNPKPLDEPFLKQQTSESGVGVSPDAIPIETPPDESQPSAENRNRFLKFKLGIFLLFAFLA